MKSWQIKKMQCLKGGIWEINNIKSLFLKPLHILFILQCILNSITIKCIICFKQCIFLIFQLSIFIFLLSIFLFLHFWIFAFSLLSFLLWKPIPDTARTLIFALDILFPGRVRVKPFPVVDRSVRRPASVRLNQWEQFNSSRLGKVMVIKPTSEKAILVPNRSSFFR